MWQPVLVVIDKILLMRNVFLILISTLYLSSCNPGTSDKPADQKAENSSFNKQWATAFLDSFNAKFAEQVASGDSVALSSNYWPDAELLLDYSDVVKGKDIQSAWGAAIRMGLKEVSFSTTDVTGSPTFIIETGNYEMKDAKKAIIDKGKYIVVWENRNGEWKLYRDIGSTSMPAPK
jgi:ketosteroid isomerase-like protein